MRNASISRVEPLQALLLQKRAVAFGYLLSVTPDLFRGPTRGTGIPRAFLDSDVEIWTPEHVRGDKASISYGPTLQVRGLASNHPTPPIPRDSTP